MSKYIKGQDRTQITLFPVSLDDAVDPENEVRLIDVFVDSLKFLEFAAPNFRNMSTGTKTLLIKTNNFTGNGSKLWNIHTVP